MEYRLVVKSDGTVRGTTVHTPDGVDLTSLVSRIRFDHAAGELPRARVTFLCPLVDVIAPEAILGEEDNGVEEDSEAS